MYAVVTFVAEENDTVGAKYFAVVVEALLVQHFVARLEETFALTVVDQCCKVAFELVGFVWLKRMPCYELFDGLVDVLWGDNRSQDFVHSQSVKDVLLLLFVEHLGALVGDAYFVGPIGEGNAFQRLAGEFFGFGIACFFVGVLSCIV